MQPLVILSRNHEAAGVQSLVEAAAVEPAIPLQLIDPHDIELHYIGGKPAIMHGGEPFEAAGIAVIPRLSGLASEYSMLALRHFELCGARVLNSYASTMRIRLKFHALQELAAAGIPTAETVLLKGNGDIAAAAEKLGGYPLILKFLRGNQGRGVVFAADAAVVHSMLDALNAIGYDAMLQRFYPRGAREDMRVVVLGGEARWAVRRLSAEGNFRTNFHSGGSFEPAEMTDELKQLAERGTASFGLGFAGVDIIEDDAGRPLVLEVNSSPGFATVGGAYGIKVARAVLEHTLNLSNKKPR